MLYFLVEKRRNMSQVPSMVFLIALDSDTLEKRSCSISNAPTYAINLIKSHVMILGQRLLKNDHSNLGNKTESFRCALLQLFCRKIIIKITICVDWHSWMKVIAMDGVILLRFLVNVCNKGMKSIWALCWTADNSMHIHWSITKTVIYDTFLESRV